MDDSSRAARSGPKPVLRDIIQPPIEQQRAIESMFDALRDGQGQQSQAGEAEVETETERRGSYSSHRSHHESRHYSRGSALACAIHRFYIALICHEVGAQPFRSPVVSFGAMLSRAALDPSGRK